MSAAFGPVAAVLASFALGVVAASTPRVRCLVPRTLSLLRASGAHANDEPSRWRRAALSAAVAFGIAVCLTPVGFLVALSGHVIAHGLNQVMVVGGLAALCCALAASMFGAFEIALPGRLRERLATIGGEGYRGAVALGVIVPLAGAATTVPLAGGLAAAMLVSSKVWLGAAVLSSFALGIGTHFFFASVVPVRLPAGPAWGAAAKWIGGVALGYLAFLPLRDRFAALLSYVKNPHYDFGLTSGAVLLTGVILGLGHVLAAGSTRRRPLMARVSLGLKLASIVPAVAGASLLFSWAPHPHGDAPPVVFVTDEAHGRAMAFNQHQPVVVVFNAQWCCKEIEHEIFPDPRVREEALRFVSIFVDATDEDADGLRALQDKYKVVGLPTMIVLDSDGTELTRFNSSVAPEVLAGAMTLAR